MLNFTIKNRDVGTRARTGIIRCDRGEIHTPIFMPVGTLGTVKGIHQRELTQEIGAEIILGNTYHLYLRPGTEILEQAGGLHKFIAWDKPMLTDSGGYQVYSLSHRRKISEKGVTFQSHIDGSKHVFTPETVIDIQRSIGADFIMAFDECTPYPCDYHYAKESMELTHRWLKRCLNAFEKGSEKYGYRQTLLPIVQGSTYEDLRRFSAETIARFELPANAIGGLSVGEPGPEMYRITEQVCDILPEEKARYLMGVGTPENILECIGLGVDMFDCVLPSRNGRHGLLYTAAGSINIKNAKWKSDHAAIDPDGHCEVSRKHSKAYLHHLFRSGELLGGQIATLHNLSFYLWLVKEARNQIEGGTFGQWKERLIPTLNTRL